MTSRLSALKARIRARHAELDSWRELAISDFGGQINATTLRLFAVTDYVPKEERLLVVLGLKKERQPKSLAPAPSPEWWGRVEKQAIKVMARETKRAVIIRKGK